MGFFTGVLPFYYFTLSCILNYTLDCVVLGLKEMPVNLTTTVLAEFFFFFCMQCMHSFWRHSLDIVDKMNSYNNTVLQNKLHCAPYTYISLKHSWHHSRYTETTFQLVLKWNSIKTFTRSVKNFNQRSIVLSQ